MTPCYLLTCSEGEISKLGYEPILEYTSAQRIIISPMHPYMGIGYNITHSIILFTLNLSGTNCSMNLPWWPTSSALFSNQQKPGYHNEVQILCVVNMCGTLHNQR